MVGLPPGVSDLGYLAFVFGIIFFLLIGIPLLAPLWKAMERFDKRNGL